MQKRSLILVLTDSLTVNRATRWRIWIWTHQKENYNYLNVSCSKLDLKKK